MTNQSMGTFLLIFALLGLPTTLFSIINRKKSDVSVCFILMCVCNIAWVTLYAFEFLAPSAGVALFLQNCKFVFIGASSVFVYLVVLSVLRKRVISKMVIFGLLIIPLCTMVVCITDALFETKLLYISMDYELIDGIRVIVEEKGLWFWVHCFYCYTLLLVAIVMMIRYYFRMPLKYRMPVSLLMLGMLLTLIMTVLAVIQVLPYRFDSGPLAAILSQSFYYFAVFFPHSVDLLMSSREVVFENAAYPILLLDDNDSIVDYNKYAEKIGYDVGITQMKGSGYHNFLSEWQHKSDATITEDNPGVFTIHGETGDTHYEVVESQMFSETEKHKQIGIYVEIKNITPTMMQIHMLQNDAYFDNLTGLNNKNYFNRISQQFDKESFFPLGIMVGDLNNLKSVNDTSGHIAGDKLLQKIAEILNIYKPAGSIVFRIGGDEFLALIPNADIQKMETFIKTVRDSCAEAGEEGNTLSIALGYKFKTNNTQTIMQIVNEADLAMYKDKYDRRH